MQKEVSTTGSKNFQTFENDLLNTKIYTLQNGLTVYLSINSDEPRIDTAIAFRAGSKNDPRQTTGLAHYMEHMLFKGTPNVGTTNWEEEKVILDKISDLYEAHLEEQDSSKKMEIYKEIDKLSFKAAELAIPNEYDKILSSLGAKGTNAYTSYEKTVYLNDIPSNELEKWMKVESNRFKTLVLRLFHTEMETVYEEYNRALDNDYVKSWRSLYKGLYQSHPYGIPVIGKGEHLKNPSMKNIYDFFYTYYRPNNAAIILSGDLDPEKTIALLEKYFGSWEASKIPEFEFVPEGPITKPVFYENYGSQTEHLYFAFRFGGIKSTDSMMIRLVGNLLFNEVAGLIDTNIIQSQKVLQAAAFEMIMTDYSHHVFFGLPKNDQSLDEVRDVLLNQLEKLKKGEFEDWLIEAVINQLRYKQLLSFRKNKGRVAYLVDVFSLGLSYEDAISFYDKMEKITKEEVIEFVKANYNQNYVLTYKRQGQEAAIPRVDKPPLTPIPINRDSKSAFFEELIKEESESLKPEFLDFEKQITQSVLKNGNAEIPFYYVKNEKDKTFKFYKILDIGSRNHSYLGLALNYLQYLGTSKYASVDYQKELFKLGLEFKTVCEARRSYLVLTGLEKSFAAGLDLLEHLLVDVQVDAEAYQMMVQGILKKRQDRRLSKDVILHQALYNYAIYGVDSPFQDVIPEKELLEMDPQILCDLIKSLKDFPSTIMFHGQSSMEEAKALVAEKFELPKELKQANPRKEYQMQETISNRVFFVDYDQTQVEILLVNKKGIFNKDILAKKSLFNEYFGAGLSSIVFQEIREAKALAYSAYAWYTTPNFADRPHFIKSYIGTQPDKLKEAVEVFLYLMNNMPRAAEQFNASKDAALKRIESERIKHESIFWNYISTRDKGLDQDLRKDIYKEIKTMTIDDLADFFESEIKGSKFNYLVVGKKSEIDFELLGQLGPVCELDLDEIFGY